ncbi:MAG: 1-acyl-sn-glycerol-3-phosphate acyltransferase [Anaerolineales bacterium]|nr:1-acyl-sn-glycerol-3-phosphate acyltransferase [Anaerolineales bacterium]MCX7754652.1 1-acyl-sn-glycerol-3-phosphate acyltransferase [Anaerolineales bacterium]MDW8278314.1 1-acyl-sn-glycerol-3-phosphate acyltransferase [Anaerolineales bacterium]
METLTVLTQINLDDLVVSFGWQNAPLPAALLRILFHGPARKFARQMLTFDAEVAERGLAEAAQALLQRYVRSLSVHGAEHIPATGPALFLSNHPGMVDTLALFVAIRRPDLKIIAAARPFLQSLKHVSPQLIFVSESPAQRMSAVRQAAAHLKAGGAALTFPAGKIEPDAAVYPGALDALQGWSESASAFLRFAPQTWIIPTFVQGVLWDKAVKHPLTRIKRTREERERLGAAFQLLMHVVLDKRPLHVTVQFGAPLRAEETQGLDSATLHARVLERMRALIGECGNR